MNRLQRMERAGGLVVSAVVVAGFTGLMVAVAVAGDEPRTSDQIVAAVFWSVVFAVPWVIAGQLLWRAWWRRTGAGLVVRDGPARLLAAAVDTLPEDRRDWGVAMVAELARVSGRSSRWRFAVGSACAAAFPPRGGRVPLVVAGVLAVAAIVASWLATGYALPALRVFALTFVALVGGLATFDRGALAAGASGRAGPGDRGHGVGGRRRLRGVHRVLLPDRLSVRFGGPHTGGGGGVRGRAGRLLVAGVDPAAVARR
ncbi:MAG: hypothetical protein ACRDJO_13035 [Actinomycetota bacterium]